MPANYVLLEKITVGAATNLTSTMRFNGDTGSNYSVTYINGDGTTATSGRQNPISNIITGEFYTYNSTQIIQIMNYSNSTTYKTALIRANTPSTSGYVQGIVGLWRSTSSITSLQILGTNLASGSTFTLYGIKSA